MMRWCKLSAGLRPSEPCGASALVPAPSPGLIALAHCPRLVLLGLEKAKEDRLREIPLVGLVGHLGGFPELRTPESPEPTPLLAPQKAEFQEDPSPAARTRTRPLTE